MKTAIFFLSLILTISFAFGQNARIDSLNKLISKATSDTARINLEIKKIDIISNTNLDTAITMGLQTLKAAREISYYKGEVHVRRGLAGNFIFKGNFKAAKEQLDYLEHFIKPSEDSSDFADLYGTYGFFYSEQNMHDTAISFYEKAIEIDEHTKDTLSLLADYINIGISYQQESNYPMALLYQQKTLKLADATKDEIDKAYAYVNMGIIYAVLNDSVRAEKNYLDAAALGKRNDLKNVELYAYSNLASMYIDSKKWALVYEFAMK